MRFIAHTRVGRLGAGALLAGALIIGNAPVRADDEAAPAAPLGWPTSPLPASEQHRFDATLQLLEPVGLAMASVGAPRYKCWLDKLKTSDVDDRLVEWANICPSTTGALGNAFVVGPCDVRGFRPTQAEIQAAFSSVDDVEAKGARLGIMTHLKASMVLAVEMTTQPVENLTADHDDAMRAIEKLDEWANAEMGGSSAMPTAYVSIKDWIGRRQRDPRSLYSCH
jgi:hypothetical protein